MIRPCLSLSHTDLQRLCLDAGWEWREDATNTDTTRLRSAIRHTILPQLEQLRPGTSRRAAASAALLRDASRLIDDRVRAILQIAVRRPDSLTIARASLAAERPIILGALLKAAATRLLRGRRQDRLTRSALSPVIRELRSHTRRTRRYSAAGLTITTTPDSLRLDLPDA